MDKAAPRLRRVGGHAGVETADDGSLIINPVLHRQGPTLVALLPFTPKFLGTLKLEGTPARSVRRKELSWSLLRIEKVYDVPFSFLPSFFLIYEGGLLS